MKTQHTYYRLPWRVVKNDEGTWEIWTRLDEPPGSRNNYQIASDIQNEDEAKVLATAPELIEALKWIADRLERGGKAATQDSIDQARAAISKAI